MYHYTLYATLTIVYLLGLCTLPWSLAYPSVLVVQLYWTDITYLISLLCNKTVCKPGKQQQLRMNIHLYDLVLRSIQEPTTLYSFKTSILFIIFFKGTGKYILETRAFVAIFVTGCV